MLSYNPKEIPELTQELIDEANSKSLKLIAVMCIPKSEYENGGDGEGSAMFYSLMSDLPRIGECIETQDAKRCLVVDVRWKVTKRDGSLVRSFFSMIPTVIAIMESE